MLSSVLPVLRNLPSDHPRVPPLPGLKRRPVTPFPLLLLLIFLVGIGAYVWSRTPTTAAAPVQKTATGRVLQVERIGANVPANGQSAFVKYRFLVGKDLVYGSEIAPPEAAIPDVGDRIEISYSPTSPQNNYRVAAAASAPSNAFSGPLAIAFAASFFLIWLIFMVLLLAPTSPRDWLAWRRARNLYRNGEITAGRIQFVRPTAALRAPNKIADYEIVATYKVEGVRLLATTRTNNAWLVNQLAPEIEVVVAYDPLKPERAVILEPFAF